MKRLILIFSVLLMTSSPIAFANNHNNSNTNPKDLFESVCRDDPNAVACRERNNLEPTGNNSIVGPNGVLTRTAQILAVAVGIAAVIMVILGGLQYILAAGDSSRISSAKNTILYALIGVVVALLAQSIIVFVLRRL